MSCLRRVTGTIAILAVISMCVLVVATITGYVDREQSLLIQLAIVAMGSTSTGAYFTIRRNEEKKKQVSK